MTFTYRHRKTIALASLLFLLLVVGLFFLFRQGLSKKKQTTDSVVILSGKKEEKKEPQKEEEIYYQVDIKGQIINPGIYSVKKGSRVIDVIRLAGDLTDQADTSVLNLSKKVSDEMVIIIYSKEEVQNFKKTKEIEQERFASCEKKDEESLQNDACITSSTVISEKISLNLATKEELLSLPGIGEAKADAILAYRTEKGPFTAIEEIKNISGIGEALFAQIKENITV